MIRPATALLCLAASLPAASSGNIAAAQTKAAPMTAEATGTFDVKLTPRGEPTGDVGAMTIAKTFHGEIDGTSVGQMLAVRTPVEGSAGYVAMERVTATIAGHRGTFALQHSGTMNRGAQSLTLSVVPDSGTDALAGITGTMTIAIEGGVHRYVFRYALAG